MTVSIKDNKAFVRRIAASIIPQKLVTRKESVYVGDDALVVNSSIYINNSTTSEYSSTGPNIILSSMMIRPFELLEMNGVAVDDISSSKIRIYDDKKYVIVDGHNTSSFIVDGEYTDTLLFSDSYNEFINMIQIKNKRVGSIMNTLCSRKLHHSIEYEVNSKLYSATLKSKVKMAKDLDTYSMYIEDSTNVYTHTSAKDIIDELLALPYEFHGTCINYSAIDCTRSYGKFVIDKMRSEAEANQILSYVNSNTSNIARRLI
jgi:hypothetical protein